MTPPFASPLLVVWLRRLGMVSMVGIVTIGCGSPQESPAAAPAAEAPAVVESNDGSVRLAVDSAVVTDGRLRFEGSTNLIDGSLVAFVLEHDGFASGDFDGYLEGLVTVQNGSFSQELEVTRWPAGHARLRLAFSLAPGHGSEQPPGVTEAYGAQGERLLGPDVTDTAGSRKVEVRFDVPLP